jgi:hypothetical protein
MFHSVFGQRYLRYRKAVDETPPYASELNLGYLGKGFPALHDIRDKILVLSLGNAFLCEEVFLKKTGIAIESQLDNLRQEIIDRTQDEIPRQIHR